MGDRPPEAVGHGGSKVNRSKVNRSEIHDSEVDDKAPDGERARLLAALTRRISSIADPTPGDPASHHDGRPPLDPDTAASARLLETLVAYAGDMLLVVDETGTIQFASPSVERFLGHAPADLVGGDVFSFIATDDLQRVVEIFAQALDHDLPAAVFQTIVTTASGDRRWVEAITIDLVEDPAVGAFVTTLRDVTDRVEAEQLAVYERQRFENLVDSLPDVIVRLDTDLRPIYGNAAARATDPSWLGAGSGAPTAFADLDEQNDQNARELQLVLETGEARTFESSISTRSGTVWLSSNAMPERDASGTITGILIVTRDVTGYRARTEELARRALEDPLTGLANRSRLEAELERALFSGAESATPVGVLFADLDGFKAINDRYGHAVGDKLLQTFARRAREALRPSDLIARFGGDEFVVLPNRLRISAELESLAARLHTTVQDPFEIDGRMLSISLSIGIATAPPRAALTHADLLGRADQAMYASKRQGRNRSTVWSHAITTDSPTAAP